MELTIDQAFQKAIEAHKAGKSQEANQYYTAILKKNPNHPDANHNLGVLAVNVGKIHESLSFFRNAVDNSPNIKQFWLSYIDALIKLNLIEDAITAFDEAKKNGIKGNSLRKLERILNLQAYTESNDKNIDSINASILDTMKLDQAIRIAKKNTIEGSIDQARSIYQDILAKFPKNKKAINGIKDLSKISNSKNTKIEDPPKNKLQSLINHYRQGQIKRTLSESAKLVLEFPNSGALYNIIGVANQGLGNLDHAIKAYKKAISINPNFVEAYNNMGIIFRKQGNLEEAIEIYKKALSINPEYAKAYNNMGIVLKDQGKLEMAIKAYDKALSLSPEYAEAHMNLSVARLIVAPQWHISMINDHARYTAYLDGLKLAINDGDFVLEIGTGSGLLAMMAARAGAKKVITCETSESIARVAREVISENGYSDKIKVINKKSTELVIGEDLPKKADIIISEVLSADFVGEGVQTALMDANIRLLSQGGKMLPESGDIRIALLGESKEIKDNMYIDIIDGFDLSKFNTLSGNKFSLKLKNMPKLLSEGIVAFKFDLYSSQIVARKELVLTLTAKESGTCYGLIQWIGIQIFQEVTYENKPGKFDSHWPTPIYRFDEPVHVLKGQQLRIKATLLNDKVWFKYQS